jgi:hypothetical protein
MKPLKEQYKELQKNPLYKRHVTYQDYSRDIRIYYKQYKLFSNHTVIEETDDLKLVEITKETK